MNQELSDYIAQLDSETKRADSISLVKILEEEPGFRAALHGKIIGFGLYINKLSDVDEKVLRSIVRRCVVDMSKKYSLHGARRT